MPCAGAESEDSDRPVAMLQLLRFETLQISYFRTILRLYEAIIKQDNMIPRYFEKRMKQIGPEVEKL